MRMLGIDYGKKKIGLAFGDTDTRVAVPLEVIVNNGARTLQALCKKVSTDQMDCVIVGVPLATGSHHGPEQLEITRAFIKRLRGCCAVPVEEEDESYTTSESIHLQREGGTHAPEDALAAMLILQGYMDRIS